MQTRRRLPPCASSPLSPLSTPAPLAQHPPPRAPTPPRPATPTTTPRRSYIAQRAPGRSVELIAKLEAFDALANMDAIIEAADGIMVARGDLGAQVGGWGGLVGRGGGAPALPCPRGAAGAGSPPPLLLPPPPPAPRRPNPTLPQVPVEDVPSIQKYAVTKARQVGRARPGAAGPEGVRPPCPLPPVCRLSRLACWRAPECPSTALTPPSPRHLMIPSPTSSPPPPQLGKPAIVAHDLLRSMIEYPIPTRAEVGGRGWGVGGGGSGVGGGGGRRA
jgi:hypothetical protein